MEKVYKISIRFYNNREVRAVWNTEADAWYFSVIDIISAINEQDDYTKTRNYWKYLKARLKKEKNELVSSTTQLRLRAADGKKYLTDTINVRGISELAKRIHNQKASEFLDWLIFSENSIDGKSKQKAYELKESGLINTIEVGTIKGLQQIHSYIFGGLFDFAGQIRTKTISKGGFTFCLAQYLPQQLHIIEQMPETNIDEVFNKYVEMNVAHPFMEGNGRSTRIWLDMILKYRFRLCIDWSQINKKDYLEAMTMSVSDATCIKTLLNGALTDKINDREIFMKGIDYSYYYEQEENL
ncbi:MAG: cell filamentation protein Fic [Bacteroidia bacterium]|nr:cell filamentation protein Fic [Bacteroidia bacterium]